MKSLHSLMPFSCLGYVSLSFSVGLIQKDHVVSRFWTSILPNLWKQWYEIYWRCHDYVRDVPSNVRNISPKLYCLSTSLPDCQDGVNHSWIKLSLSDLKLRYSRKSFLSTSKHIVWTSCAFHMSWMSGIKLDNKC